MERSKALSDFRTMKNSGFRSLFDTEVNIKIRVLTILALAGAVGNTLGFLANLILYGFNFVTGFCCLCAVLIICNLFFGLRSKHNVFLGYLMLFMLNVLEFPLLTLTYGAVMYPYLIIGFHAVVMVFEKRKRIFLCILLGLYDLAIIVYSSLNPYIFGSQDSVGLMGSALVTFAISIATVAALNIMWQNVYMVETIEIDPVTKSLSRIGFSKNAEKILSSDTSTDYLILYFNIVSFKTINSIFGIDGGNRFLHAVADRLARAPFAPRLVGRLSTDHFVCLVKKDAFQRSCLDNLCKMPFSDKGRTILAMLNCGIYEITDRSLPVSSMCDMANTALRYIRNSDSRIYAEYDSRAASGYREETEVLGEVDIAIRSGQFKPYYQPIVDCKTGKIISAEALARWIHPELGVIPPSVFIPILEKKDMISSLDSTIARRVHYFLEKCITDGHRIVPISVNLSRTDLYDHPLMEELSAMVRSMPRDQQWHRFEITESVYEGMSEYTLNIISALRKSGAVILVDDFGSGYSSLGMITDYEFDIIKLDMQFASKIAGNERINGVVECLVEMSHRLGAKVVAEGVETEEQYQAIKDCGCDYVQGYYFYKPVTCEELLELLDAQ